MRNRYLQFSISERTRASLQFTWEKVKKAPEWILEQEIRGGFLEEDT